MNKRLMILILIILSIGVTYYIEVNKKEVSLETRAKVEAELAQDPTFPARPVWWEKGHLLGVGVIHEGQNHDADARRVCQLLNKYGFQRAPCKSLMYLRFRTMTTGCK